MSTISAASLSGVLALTLLASSVAQAAPGGSGCFYPNELMNWTTTPDSKTVYLRTGANNIYRLGLDYPCSELQTPQARLILKPRGPELYCSPMNFDLWASGPHGPPMGCLVKSMTKLTPSEVGELPKSVRP